MITLDLTPPPREDRAADTDRTYTTDRVGALMASSAGPGAVATAVAAVEIAAGLWSRALALATVTPQTARTRAITPAILELAGRSLARRGQVVFDLEVDAGGALALIPCAAATVLLGVLTRRAGSTRCNATGRVRRSRATAPVMAWCTCSTGARRHVRGKEGRRGRPRTSPARSWQVSRGNYPAKRRQVLGTSCRCPTVATTGRA